MTTLGVVLKVVLIGAGVFLCLVVLMLVLIQGPFFRRSSQAAQRRGNDELQAEIRIAMPYLVSDYHGVFLTPDPKKYPAMFDYVVAIVGIEKVAIRIIRGRGEFSAHVSFTGEGREWFDLLDVIPILCPEERIDLTQADLWRLVDPLERVLTLLLDERTQDRIAVECRGGF